MAKVSYTLAEAVAVTGLSRSSFYRIFSEHKLTPRKAGKRVLILADDLDTYVRSLPVADIGNGR